MACLIDTSVWVALTFNAHSNHSIAEAAYQSLSPANPAVFCRSTQQSFLRLATNARVLSGFGVTPFTNRQALDVLAQTIASSAVVYWDEPPGVESRWFQLASRDVPSPQLWMDAYLAAFAIAGDLDLMTLDHGFRKFVGDGLKLQLILPP